MTRTDGEEGGELKIKVTAETQEFSREMDKIHDALAKGLLGAVRKGSLGFDDLRRIALRTIDDIASQALSSLFAANDSKGGKGGIAGLLNIGGLLGSILGLPGRAAGGNVAPGRGYLVGERGPELFVPTSAGRVESSMAAGGAREVRVSINIVTPPGGNAQQALQRSSRQVASAVRRALASH